MGRYCQVRIKDHHFDRREEVSGQPRTSRKVQKDRLRLKKRAKLPKTREHAQRLQSITGKNQRPARPPPIRRGHIKTVINLHYGRIRSLIDQVATSSEINIKIKLNEDLHSQGLDDDG